MAKLSVIMPCYNAEALLARAVESVLTQSFCDFELFLVDDGSKDSTPALCDAYAEKDSRVQVIHQENAGASAARNAALDEAKGEYIAFLDADDYLRFDAYEKMFAAMEASGAPAACCGYVHAFEDGSLGAPSPAPFADGFHTEEEVMQGIVLPLLQDRLREGMVEGMVWRYIFRRDLIEARRLRFPKCYYLEDELFLLRYFAEPVPIASVDEGLYFYYLNRRSVTHRYHADLTKLFETVLAEKERIIGEYRLSVRPDWKDNCAWMGLLADVGNEFGGGHEISMIEHAGNLKALTKVPMYAHALASYVPVGMNKRKTLVASLLRKKCFLPLAALYVYKNRK